MIVIGITGPTGAGKTTALKEIERLGGVIIDCDIVYHHLLVENEALKSELEYRFGSLRNKAGEFQRKALGAIVFHDAQALEDLNSIAHRYVYQEVIRLLEEIKCKGKKLVAIDAIGLFESKIAMLCDYTVAVIAPPQQRIERIMQREGISRDYAEARVTAQKPDLFYIEHCEYILNNEFESSEKFGKKAASFFASFLGEVKN